MQIDQHLIYWPKFLIQKAKQRLTRLIQVNLRARRIEAEAARLGERTVPKLAPKIRRREETRERKAMTAARVERAIERELLERLRSGAYGDQPLNVNEGIWNKVLAGLERDGQGVNDEDRDIISDDGEEEELEVDEMENEYEVEHEGQEYVEFLSDMDESDNDLEDIEDWLKSDDDESDQATSLRNAVKVVKGKKVGKKRKRDTPETEQEIEYEIEPRSTLAY